jgi:adenosylcobinamide-GDP ribazoletransferase
MSNRHFNWWVNQWHSISAALVFYTCLPVPASWTLNFSGMARFAPIIGIAIGILLGLLDAILTALNAAPLTGSAVVVIAAIALTGGLHLDGAIDLADGVAVLDPQRRLEVMRDSVTGAFGAMAAVAIVVLKVAALADLSGDRAFVLMTAAGWGRWGQVVAIVRYPYLRTQGKGSLHQSQQSWRDLLPGAIALLLLALVHFNAHPDRWLLSLGSVILGVTLSTGIGAWIARQLGGHTGDTYGAIVEWTEAFMLVGLSIVSG